MKIIFLSNYFNHHQSSLSENLYHLSNGEYRFIATEPMEEERLKMGWGISSLPSYVIQYQNNPKYCDNLVMDADVVLIGSAPKKLIKERLKHNRLIFCYSERIFKKGYNLVKLFYYLVKNKSIIGIDNAYLLCSSAFTAADYTKTGLYLHKTYKWGYFPLVKEYGDIVNIINNKKGGSILWAGRFLNFKHPEKVILIAEKLKQEGYNFNVNMIGIGPMEDQLKKMVHDKQLTDEVHFLGSMSPDKVREYMEQSQIFMFTSDFNEGWGAVLNESMNSGCAVVASHAIGSVPFLIEDKQNGLIYQNDDIDDLYNKVKWLLDNPQKRQEIGKNAYLTMFNTWNAKIAAERVIKLSEEILSGNKNPNLFVEGPCSIAEKIKNNWFNNMR